MLDDKARKWFFTFWEDMHPQDDYRQFYRDEEHWAFMRAYENGNRDSLTLQAMEKLADKGSQYKNKMENKYFRNQILPKGNLEKEAHQLYQKMLKEKKSLSGIKYDPRSRML